MSNPEIENLKEELELKLIERERRLSSNIYDLYASYISVGWRHKRFSAALKASLFSFFAPANAAAAGLGIVGILTLVLAWQNNQLVQRQNELLGVQNLLQESSRRAGLSVELTEVLNRISDSKLEPYPSELIDSGSKSCKQQDYGHDFKIPTVSGRHLLALPDLLLGRLVALSNSFRPYRYLDVDRADMERDVDSGLSAAMSPERAQLLFALANAHIALSQVADAGGKFNQVPLGGAQLSGMQINKIDLAASDFNGAILVYTNFAEASLQHSLLIEVNATCSNFSGANLTGSKLIEGQFMGARFDRAIMQGANLFIGRFEGASFAGADLRGVFSCTAEHIPIILDTKEKFLKEIGADVDVTGAIFGAEMTLGAESPEESCKI